MTLFILLLILFSPLIQGGVIFDVTTSAELFDGLTDTDSNVIIKIHPGNYTLTETASISGKTNLSVIATDTPSDLSNIRTIITCVDAKLLDISGSNVTFFGIDFRDCTADDNLIYATSSRLDFSECRFTNNNVSSLFGLVFSTGTFSNSLIDSNQGNAAGAFISTFYSSIQLSHVQIANNRNLMSNGIISWGVCDNCALVLDDCEATNNSVVGWGGFLEISASGTRVATITNSKIRYNKAGSNGGGIWANNVNMTISNTHIENNECPENGGGIFVTFASNDHLTIIDSVINGNTALRGGGVFIYGATNAQVYAENVQLVGNTASNPGSAFRIVGGNATVDLNHVVMTTNTGGSAYYSYVTMNQMTYVTITNNTEGIFCEASSFNLKNSSIYQNKNAKDFSGCPANTCEYSGMFTANPCLDTCTRDRCSVCNGNNACLSGCDNEPWSYKTLDICDVCGGTDNCTVTSTSTTSSSSSSSSSSSTSTSTTTTSGTSSSTTTSDSTTTTSSTSTSTTASANNSSTTSGDAIDHTTTLSETTSSDSDSSILIISIVIPVVVILSLFIVSAIIIYKKRKSKKDPPQDMIELTTTKEEAPSISQVVIPQSPSSSSVLDVKKITDIEVLERLGGGQFSDVYRGLWMGTTVVALKQLKKEEQLDEFMKEALILVKLSHKNVLQFYGIYTSPYNSRYIVTEYLDRGSLRDLLHNEGTKLTMPELLSLCLDISSGMAYLAGSKIVHSDLAARNVLITSTDSKYLAKIADLGLGKIVREESNYYTSNDKAVPIKWASPEVVEFGKYSELSDVWSFGIVMWEIFSYGKTPYPGMTNGETLQQITKGYRLPPPDNCPENIYDIMSSCWQKDPAARPRFKELYQRISACLPKKAEDPIPLTKADSVDDFYYISDL